MQKIGLILLIMLLLPLAGAKTIHVDDDRREYSHAEYTSIQQAIDNASDGDVILVHLGSYSPFKVDKRVNITGVFVNENFPEVIASSENNKIDVLADGVTLMGFVTNATTFVNSSNNKIIKIGFANENGSGLIINGKNNMVAGNVFVLSKVGIVLHSDNNTLFENKIMGCDFGIAAKNVRDNTILLNEFRNNNVSIVMFNSRANGVMNNTIYGSRIIGLHLNSSSENVISENRFINGTGWALRIVNGHKNVIGGNIFDNNTLTKIDDVPAGFGIFIMNSTESVIVSNDIKGLIQNYVGIFAFNVSDLTIEDVFVFNNVFGAYIWKCKDIEINDSIFYQNVNGTHIDSSEIVIKNTLYQNTDFAIDASSSDVEINSSIFLFNLNTIRLSNSKNAKIHDNLIAGNKYGITLDNSHSCAITENFVANVVDYALKLLESNNNFVYNNTMVNNTNGIMISGTNNVITRNTVGIKNGYGEYVLYLKKRGNLIYLNNFLDDAVFSYGGNKFHSPKKIRYIYNGKEFNKYLGNFWGDVTDAMLKMLDPDNDGILNKQKTVHIEVDRYPLAKKIENYQILT